MPRPVPRNDVRCRRQHRRPRRPYDGRKDQVDLEWPIGRPATGSWGFISKEEGWGFMVELLALPDKVDTTIILNIHSS
jgi:hypothetical protein